MVSLLFTILLILPVVLLKISCASRYLGPRGIQFILFSYISIILFLACNFLVYTSIKLNVNYFIINNLLWFTANNITVSWVFKFDTISLVISGTVLLVSLNVLIYASSYLQNDPHLNRFIIIIILFTLAMLIFVCADDLLVVFAGWEWLGICSYLLINFWFTRIQANKAALKALFVNRIGDVFFLLGIGLIINTFQTTNLTLLSNLVPYFTAHITVIVDWEIRTVNIIILLLFMAVIGKSAQLGLHVWLVDAMEGPTPVSALLHAATMVTAGVLLIIKTSFLLTITNVELARQIISYWGLLSAIFAAILAVVQTDSKKLIAYSTCSQLGYIVFMCGILHFNIVLFHLFNHAFFKALIFLSAGIIIHTSSINDQNLRSVGYGVVILPILYLCSIIGTLSMIGFPFLSGFYSKDLIIESVFVTIEITNNLIIWINLLIPSITAVYSCKLIYLIYLSNARFMNRYVLSNFHFPPLRLIGPVIILMLLSLFSGYSCSDLMVGLGENVFDWLILPENNYINTEFLPFYIKLIPLFISGLAVLLYIIFVLQFNKLICNQFFINIFNQLNYFFYFKGYFDFIVNSFSKIILIISYKYMFVILDKQLIEGIFVYKITSFLNLFSVKLIGYQTGKLQYYGSMSIISILFFIQLITV